MRLHPLTANEAVWAEELEPKDNRFGLNLIGVAAAGGGTVFLYGSLLHGGQRLRSFLAASQDGGLTFKETLPPYESSEVTHAQLIGCVGWAIVGWRAETRGDLTLLGTGDCGARWFTLSELPRSDETAWPLALEFSDTFNGAITLGFESEPSQRTFLRTQDGGRSFSEVQGRASSEETSRLQLETVGNDGTRWRLRTAEGRHRLERRDEAQQGWILTAVLPVWLRAATQRLEPL